jgi:hypothetical protein
MQLVPIISGGQPLSYNVGMAETFSWIPIANDQGRDLYARASYITNLSDLTVSISAGSFDIGAVHLLDHTNGLYASIADIGLTGLDFGKGAVRVLTQDLHSTLDNVALGDANGNVVGVVGQLSALKAYIVNSVSAVSITNPVTSVTISAPISSYATILNPVTAVSVTNFPTQLTAVSVTNFPTQLTAISVTNQLTGVTVLNPITAVNVTNFPTQLTAVSVTNFPTQLTAVNVTNFPTQLTAVSVTNQLTGVTVLNPVTAVSVSNQITGYATANNQVVTNNLLNTLTANNATSNNQIITNTLLNTLTANIATAVNQTLTNTLLNALTASVATTANQIVTNTLLNNVTANQITQTTLQKTLTANSVYGTLSSQPLYVTSNQPSPNAVTFADSVQIDQASRLRVATPQTQWWYMATVDKDGDLRYNESFVAGASSIFVQNLASVNMTSGSTSVSGQAIRASRRRHKIIPGLSHEYTGVWNWDGQQANVVKRIGIFTQYNGYFFELSGTDVMNAVVRRRLIDGTLVEERVNQTNWNGDKLDGSGPSGENWNALVQNGTINSWVSTTPISITNDGNVYNVVYTLSAGQVQNFRQGTKATITGITPSGYNAVALISNTDTVTNRLTATYLFNPGVSASNVSGATMVQTGYHMEHTYWIDFTGGRTNRVRFGKQSDSGKIVLHTFKFDGLLGTAYENAPTLTERKEVSNFGSVTSLPSFTVMGNAFNVEAQVDITPNFNTAYSNNALPFAADGTERPVLGVALRAGEPYQRADIQIQNISIMDLGNNSAGGGTTASYPSTYFWRLVLNPGLSGVPVSTNIGKASRQWSYTTSAKLTSDGIDLISGYVTSSSPSFEISTPLNFLNMGSNIDNTDSDKVVLMLKCLSVGTNTTGTNSSSAVAVMNFVEAL